MSLRTHGVLLFKSTVLQNLFSPLKKSYEPYEPNEEPKYEDEEEFEPSYQMGNIEIFKIHENEELTLSELIEELKSISKEKLDKKIGLREGLKLKEDLAIGNKAKILAAELSKNPTKKVIFQAVEFLGSLSLIKDLEVIERERTRKVGFRSEIGSKEDEEFGRKAGELKNLLIFTLNPTNIKLAIKFLEAAEVISTLENLSSQKIKTNVGLVVPRVTKYDEEVSATAQNIANILKSAPTNKNIKTAIEFLDYIYAIESGEIKTDPEEKKSKPKVKQKQATREPVLV